MEGSSGPLVGLVVSLPGQPGHVGGHLAGPREAHRDGDACQPVRVAPDGPGVAVQRAVADLRVERGGAVRADVGSGIGLSGVDAAAGRAYGGDPVEEREKGKGEEEWDWENERLGLHCWVFGGVRCGVSVRRRRLFLSSPLWKSLLYAYSDDIASSVDGILQCCHW